MRKIAAAVAACAGLLTPAAASAAPPNPFGHACADQNGVLFCPAATLDQRVPSWDGVPPGQRAQARTALTEASVDAFRDGLTLAATLVAAGGLISAAGVRNRKATAS